MCLGCVVWRPAESTSKIRTIGVQHLYRDWNWGISDEFCSKCSVSIEVCLTLFCIFEHICSMFGSSCCEQSSSSEGNKVRPMYYCISFHVSPCMVLGKQTLSMYHYRVSCIIVSPCRQQGMQTLSEYQIHVSPDDSASPRQEIAELEVRLRQCAVFFQLIPVPEWWDGGQSGYAQEESYHVYLDHSLQWRGLLKTSTWG